MLRPGRGRFRAQLSLSYKQPMQGPETLYDLCNLSVDSIVLKRYDIAQ